MDNAIHNSVAIAARAHKELGAARDALMRAQSLFRALQLAIESGGEFDTMSIVEIGLEMTSQYAERADDEVEHFSNECAFLQGEPA